MAWYDEDEEKVTISKEVYEELLDSHLMLDCLECAGVDNWGGYEAAMKEYYQEKEASE